MILAVRPQIFVMFLPKYEKMSSFDRDFNEFWYNMLLCPKNKLVSLYFSNLENFSKYAPLKNCHHLLPTILKH